MTGKPEELNLSSPVYSHLHKYKLVWREAGSGNSVNFLAHMWACPSCVSTSFDWRERRPPLSTHVPHLERDLCLHYAPTGSFLIKSWRMAGWTDRGGRMDPVFIMYLDVVLTALKTDGVRLWRGEELDKLCGGERPFSHWLCKYCARSDDEGIFEADRPVSLCGSKSHSEASFSSKTKHLNLSESPILQHSHSVENVGWVTL